MLHGISEVVRLIRRVGNHPAAGNKNNNNINLLFDKHIYVYIYIYILYKRNGLLLVTKRRSVSINFPETRRRRQY